MIEAKDLYKSYGAVDVLKGVSLSVKTGEIVAIVGASGAGKTTLLQILGTLDSYDRGELIFNGERPGTLSSRKLSAFRNRHIGFVFQFSHLLPEFTAVENVALPHMIAGKSLAESQKRAAELLTMLGLGHRLDHKPGALSGGEQQRAAVARALVNRPDVIFADEPSGNLDSQNAEDLHRLFLDLRRDLGQTFVIVTHNPDLAELCDRKLTMSDGKMV